MNAADMPSAEVKLDILQMIMQRLQEAGYIYIGMDHFARSDDELAIAQSENKLYRNFQGYSTHSDCDLVGLWITSIGRVADCYVQNVKDLEAYDTAIQQGALPVFSGLVLNEDDRLRRAVITQLICHFSLSFRQIEQQYAFNLEIIFPLN